MTHFEGQVDKSGAALRHPEEKKANDGCLKIKGKNVFRIFFVRVHLHESSLSAPSGQARRIHAAYQQHDFPLGGTFRKFRRQTGSGAAMVGFKGLGQFPRHADGHMWVQSRQRPHGLDDAVGGFVEDARMACFNSVLEHGPLSPGFDGQKAAKEESVRRQAGPHQSRNHGGGPRQNGEAHSFFLEGLDEAVARIAHTRHARVTNDGKAFSARGAGGDFRAARLFVVVVHAQERLPYFIMAQQKPGMARVLAGDGIHLAQHIQRPQGDIRPVADGDRNKVNAVFYFRHVKDTPGITRNTSRWSAFPQWRLPPGAPRRKGHLSAPSGCSPRQRIGRLPQPTPYKALCPSCRQPPGI